MKQNQSLQKRQTESHRSQEQEAASYASDERRWTALQLRDRNADGHFVYSVATTGIYCRPTCPSKLALRKHVRFYNTGDEAEQAGFRPCKRCDPAGTSQAAKHAEAAAKACRIIESSDTAPSLEKLANEVGLSRYHFHRVFKQAVGVTPREYAASLRTGRVLSELRSGQPVTGAIYGAGYNSSSRFYERSSETLGMTPSEFQRGGKGIAIRYTIAPSPLGLAMVAGTARGICMVAFGSERDTLERELREEFPEASIEPADHAFDNWVKAIVNHIEDPAKRVDLPLDVRGTAFQQRVWQALRKIPAGHTTTYSELAASIGLPSGARAVARACATNPVSLIVPCHRVIGTDGKLHGYRWGLDRKRKLIEAEAKSVKTRQK